MKHYLALVLALFTIPSLAQSTIPVSGQKVLDNNMVPLTGQLVFTVTDASNNAVTYTPQGGSASTAPFIIPVVVGAVQNVNGFTATIANPATMSPANTRYRIQVQNVGGGTTYFTFPLTNITQAFFSYDGYAVPAGITASGAGLPHIPCSPHAQYSNTLASDPYPWVCSQLQSDKQVAWTQNPSLNPACQRGNDQAIASSVSATSTFCVDANQAFVTPGFVWAGPLPGANPTQIGLVPLTTMCASGNCGGGGIPAAPSFAVQLANSGATAFASDANITINPTTHTLATPNITAANPLYGLNMNAHLDTANDYVLYKPLPATTISNQPFPFARPWTMTQTVNRRFGPAQGTNPLSVTLNLLSGTDNTTVVEGDYGAIGITSSALAPEQGGGLFGITSNSYAVGDNVGQTMVLSGRGVSRGGDEGTENPRFFLAAINDVAGGHLATLTTDAQGNNPISVSQITSVYSFNFYEKSFILDVTAKWQSPGNIASIGTSTDTRFSYFQGDATAGITSKFGVSTQTRLTAPVDNFVYTGACGSQTVTTAQYPISGPSIGANDAFMTNYQGVGAPGENTNYNSTTGALTGFCATVASTAGMAPGTLLFIADSDYQVEFTRVISVAADGIHFTAFMKQPHFTGATVNFGGAVGNCIGADADITPIGANTTGNNPQVAIQRLCYPIVQSLAGDLVTVYTNTQGSDVNNLRSLIPSANTPKVPLTITAPVVVGGVLTSFTANDVQGNANNYNANNTGAANSGHPSVLPAPTVTVSGCTVAPVIGMSNVVIVGAGVTYAPAIISGGSGCGTVTFNIPTFLPTPFGIYPLAMVYKSEDPNLPAGTTFSNGVLTDGKPVFMPFNTAAWTIGDEIMAPDWWNGMGVSGQTNYNGNYLHALDGRNGPMLVERFSGVGNSFAYRDFENDEPTAHYFGSFANNYTKTLLSDYLVTPPKWHQADGQYSVDLELAFPPLAVSTGTISGGSIIDVQCGRNQIQSGLVDPPCLHGIDHPYNLFNSAPGGTLKNMTIFVNNTTGVMGAGGQTTTWKAPTLTAYDPVEVTTDVMLMGIVNGGPVKGPCARWDLLLTTTGNPFGQSFGRVCGWQDHTGSTQGDLSFQTNNGGGTQTYSTPLLLNSTQALFSVPITSSVASGTAPFTITSTTVVPNLNAGMIDGVTISGTAAAGKIPVATGATTATWQTPTATTGFSGTFTTTTGVGTCSFTYTNGLLTTKTGSC